MLLEIFYEKKEIFFFLEKCYMHNIFTTNPKLQIVIGYYFWAKKVILVASSNLNQ